jgi:hypothetical protein
VYLKFFWWPCFFWGNWWTNFKSQLFTISIIFTRQLLIWMIVHCIKYNIGNFQEAWRPKTTLSDIVLEAQQLFWCLTLQENRPLRELKVSFSKQIVARFHLLYWLEIKSISQTQRSVLTNKMQSILQRNMTWSTLRFAPLIAPALRICTITWFQVLLIRFQMYRLRWILWGRE